MENLPNLNNYQVIISLSEASQKIYPQPPTKTISIQWEINQIEGDPNAKYNFLNKNINELVQAILGEEN